MWVPRCPSCGAEVGEADNFCRRCGFNLSQLGVPLGSPEDEVRAVIIQRIDGIRRRDAEAIGRVVEREVYTKFDDWPPFERQGPEALDREAEALKVLRDYSYETGDWRIDIVDDVAVASFTIRYRGAIRDVSFDVRSRVTSVLVRRGDGWRIIHEHWSSFPERGPWKGGVRRGGFPW
jgi:ketosteroid isomerase-like protein